MFFKKIEPFIVYEKGLRISKRKGGNLKTREIKSESVSKARNNVKNKTKVKMKSETKNERREKERISYSHLSHLSYLSFISFIFVLFSVFILLSVGASNIVFCEPIQNEIEISDSVSPMKLEITAAEINSKETITKTVFLRNTGNKPNNYIFYIEENGKRTEKSGVLLSKNAAALLPGETYTLEISVPTKQSKQFTENELKLKIIRNPETQTPVGYIIPIKIEQSKDETDETNVKKSTGTSRNGLALIKENETEKETNNEKITQNEKNNQEAKKDLINEADKTSISSEKTAAGIKLLKAIAVFTTFLIIAAVFWMSWKTKRK